MHTKFFLCMVLSIMMAGCGKPAHPVPPIEPTRVAETSCAEHGSLVESSTMVTWRKATNTISVSIRFRCESGFEGWMYLGEK